MGSFSSPLRWSLPVIPSQEPTNTVDSFSRVCCCSSSRLPSSPDTKTTTLSSIQNSGIIACLRSSRSLNSPSFRIHNLHAATGSHSNPIKLVNLLILVPRLHLKLLLQHWMLASQLWRLQCPPQVVQCLVEAYPTACLGVGTVLSAEDAVNAMNAGARFIMSPATVKDIMDTVRGTELLYIPGVMTPTEMLSAYTAGANIVKIYPVSALGGVKYIAALKKPFSHIPMIASQGVTIDLVKDYISHGASAVVLSDAIFSKEAMLQRNYDAVYQLAVNASLQGKEAVRW
ncbi:KHG/KDPG aldolase [Linum grandiflorum]